MLIPEKILENMQVVHVSHPLADIWIASEDHPHADYHYGGTRLVDYGKSDEEAVRILKHLAFFESGVKNRLINKAFADGVLRGLEARIPQGLQDSRVLGGRCVMRPTTSYAHDVLSNPLHPDFSEVVDSVFATIGQALNKRAGTIKLTPDFGRYAHLADVLHKHTPHSLGIKCPDGGCGGKSSYTTTGIIEAVERLCGLPLKGPMTLIGADGALGYDFLQYLKNTGAPDVAICDLSYDASEAKAPRGKETHLKSAPGKFTDECLSRGGILVATTVGHELENSDYSKIPAGTFFFLAHNSALPAGSEGVKLARKLAEQGIWAVPGPILTLGGALTSRVEWFWRQTRRGEFFDKELAHEIVRRVTAYYMAKLEAMVAATGTTPHEAMFQLIADSEGLMLPSAATPPPLKIASHGYPLIH